MNSLARLQTKVHGAALHAIISGEIDLSNAVELEEEIGRAAGDHRLLILDLTQLDFLDSAGIRLLDHLISTREPDPPVRIVVATSGSVPYTLRLCGFREDLLTHSVESATESLGRAL